MTKKEYSSICAACGAHSKMISRIEPFLFEHAEREGMSKVFSSQLRGFNTLIKDLPPEYQGLTISSCAAAKTFGFPFQTRKLLKRAKEMLEPEEISYLENIEKEPWEFLLFTIEEATDSLSAWGIGTGNAFRPTGSSCILKDSHLGTSSPSAKQ